MKDLILTEQLKGLEQSKAAQIKAVFDPMVSMLESFESAYESVMSEEPSKDVCAKAKRLRLDISKIRVAADKERKALKEEYLRGGNAVQGVYNILKFAVAEKEEKLKERETYFERLEQEKKKALQADREKELAKYDLDGSLMALGDMEELVWNNFLTGAQNNWKAQKEAKRKAEEERKEDLRKQATFRERREQLLPYSQFYKEVLNLTMETTGEEFASILESAKKAKADHDAEQERIRQENERLWKEREAAEAQRKKEEEKRRILEEKERKARKAEEARRNEQLRKEREAREKAEAEARAQREAIARKEREESNRVAEASRKAALAPEKEKLENMANSLFEKSLTFKSEKAQRAIKEAAKILKTATNEM